MYGHLHPSEIDGILRIAGDEQFHLEKLLYQAADPKRLSPSSGAAAVRQRAVLYLRARRRDREAQSYVDEFMRRPWERYYATAGGVIHMMQNAHDHDDVFQAWLTEESGKTPEAMHREHGAALCMECFPWYERPLWSSNRKIFGFRLYSREWARAADLRVSNLNDGEGLLLTHGTALRTLWQAQSYLIECLEGYCEAQRVWPGQLDEQATLWVRDAVTAATAIGAATNVNATVVVAETKKVVLKELDIKFSAKSGALTTA